MTQHRMTAEYRTAQLTEIAYAIAKSKGINKLSRAAVAREAEVTDALINRYFGNREGLRAAVLDYAVEKGDYKFLAAASEYYILPSLPRSLAKEVKAAWEKIGVVQARTKHK